MTTITDRKKWMSLVAYARAVINHSGGYVSSAIIWADDTIKTLAAKVEEEAGKDLVANDLIATVETLTEEKMVLDIENDHLKAILMRNNIEYVGKQYQGELHPYTRKHQTTL